MTSCKRTLIIPVYYFGVSYWWWQVQHTEFSPRTIASYTRPVSANRASSICAVPICSLNHHMLIWQEFLWEPSYRVTPVVCGAELNHTRAEMSPVHGEGPFQMALYVEKPCRVSWFEDMRKRLQVQRYGGWVQIAKHLRLTFVAHMAPRPMNAMPQATDP